MPSRMLSSTRNSLSSSLSNPLNNLSFLSGELSNRSFVQTGGVMCWLLVMRFLMMTFISSSFVWAILVVCATLGWTTRRNRTEGVHPGRSSVDGGCNRWVGKAIEWDGNDAWRTFFAAVIAMMLSAVRLLLLIDTAAATSTSTARNSCSNRAQRRSRAINGRPGRRI
jgi:hypothetical protein